ncbi:MAG: hypothetical protein Unbinned4052contig1001_67 [Prokaryotic dsDNA virus sp.]|jgi:phage-related protein (TIGR01555 family)|nr:MAG: hypothetical protein Unbinned4052contig1001_67 [Prokaryotic dsDNA virus sp.]|tara:strand:+ start:2870 stop:4114 length:1245 start_codon:yes stop_codon:yes gene_type:complete
MSNIHEDGYRSALLGERRRQVAPTDQATMYARGGIAARVIDLPADLAMSRGVEIEGDDDRVIAEELQRLDLVGNMSDALRWSRLDGGAALMLLTDTGTLDEPLPESVGQITEIRVIELPQLSVAPGGYYDDPGEPTYGQPEYYHVRPITAGNSGSTGFFVVHESRLLPVYGDPLPSRLRVGASVPWSGRSAATAPFRSIERYEKALTLSLEVLKRKQQAVHRMKGLAELIQNGQEHLVRKRVDLVDEVRSLMNGVAVDAEDDYQVYDQNVSGIKDLIAEFQMAVSADTGIPVTALFGRAAAGLNATGENDLEGLYDLCEGIQQTCAQTAINRLIEAITRQSGIDAPRQWRIKWPSLWTPTDAQQAETRLNNAQASQAEAAARQIDLDTGTVSGDEVRQHMARDGLYGLEVDDGA